MIGKVRSFSPFALLSVLALLSVAALQAAASAAVANPGGDLDRSFGNAGRVLTPVKVRAHSTAFNNSVLRADVAMAMAGGGRVVLGGERSLVRYLPNGKLDRRFDGDGKRHVAAPGVTKFTIEDIAVDPRGGVIAVGTAWDGQGGASALIARYLPSGAPDPSFGGSAAGVVLTDFGFPDPSPTLQYKGIPVYKQAVTANGVAVDAEGRVLVTGTERAHVSPCKTSTQAYNYGYVARLAPSGELDASFGSGGIWLDKAVAWAGLPVLGPDESPFYAGDHREDCNVEDDSSLVRLDGSGQPDQAFGSGGRASILPPASSILDLAIDGKGRIWTMAQPSSVEARFRWFNQAVVSRMRPNGTADTGFGTNGQARVWLPGEESRLHAITVDSRGRALLAGQVASAKTTSQQSNHLPPHMRFALVRLNASGQLDRNFGQAGRVLTAFAPRSRTVATDLVIDGKNRILVGGPVQSPKMHGGRGFALARYLDRR